MGFEQLESSEHSDSQQQESGSCWGVASLGTTGRISLPSYLQLQLEQQLSRTEHRSS
jgi:hypothetical protein